MKTINDKKVLSIVVVYNDYKKLYSMLIKSLETQTFTDYELISVDNSNNQFSSASSAYNYGGNRANGKYILFLHQDIIFTDKNSLNKIIAYADKLFPEKFSLLGFAGVQPGEFKKNELVNTLHLMTLKCGESKTVYSWKPLEQPEEVFAVDECGFMMTKEMFSKFPFNDLGNTWHLYAVEMCLKLKQSGYHVGVIPVDAWHCSLGRMNSDYYKRMRMLVKRYGKTFDAIFTTCFSIKTSRPMADIILIRSEFHTSKFMKGVYRIIINPLKKKLKVILNK